MLNFTKLKISIAVVPPNASAEVAKHDSSSADTPDSHPEGEKHDKHGNDAAEHDNDKNNDKHHNNTRHDPVISTVAVVSNASADAAKHNNSSAHHPDGHSEGEKHNKHGDGPTDFKNTSHCNKAGDVHRMLLTPSLS